MKDAGGAGFLNRSTKRRLTFGPYNFLNQSRKVGKLLYHPSRIENRIVDPSQEASAQDETRAGGKNWRQSDLSLASGLQ